MRLLHLSFALNSDRHFSANHGSFPRACVPIGCSAMCFVASGDVATRWVSARLSLDGPDYIAATFPATVWSRHESVVHTGLKRENNNKQNKKASGSKNRGEGRGRCSGVASLGVLWSLMLPDFQMLPTPALKFEVYVEIHVVLE